LPDERSDPQDVVERLVAAADRGIVAMPSGRYFGSVIGGGLPAALAADWLTSACDQNAGLYVGGPSASVVARRRAADPRPRRRQAPRHDRPGAAAARARRAGDGRGGLTGAHGRPRAPRRARVRRRTDRLRAGRRGEHRRLRRLRGDRGRDRGPPCLAPRRRRIRALGGGEPGALPPRPGCRARGLVDHRRAQVAQRPLRLGARPLCPSSPAGLVASRSMRRSARSAGRGSPSSSIARAAARGRPARTRSTSRSTRSGERRSRPGKCHGADTRCVAAANDGRRSSS
jgi:hypothetical protein